MEFGNVIENRHTYNMFCGFDSKSPGGDSALNQIFSRTCFNINFQPDAVRIIQIIASDLKVGGGGNIVDSKYVMAVHCNFLANGNNSILDNSSMLISLTPTSNFIVSSTGPWLGVKFKNSIKGQLDMNFQQVAYFQSQTPITVNTFWNQGTLLIRMEFVKFKGEVIESII